MGVTLVGAWLGENIYILAWFFCVFDRRLVDLQDRFQCDLGPQNPGQGWLWHHLAQCICCPKWHSYQWLPAMTPTYWIFHLGHPRFLAGRFAQERYCVFFGRWLYRPLAAHCLSNEHGAKTLGNRVWRTHAHTHTHTHWSTFARVLRRPRGETPEGQASVNFCNLRVNTAHAHSIAIFKKSQFHPSFRSFACHFCIFFGIRYVARVCLAFVNIISRYFTRILRRARRGTIPKRIDSL